MRQICAASLRTRVLAIDTSIWIYQCFATALESLDAVTETDMVVAAVVDSVLGRSRVLIDTLGVSKLIFVLEGVPLECKRSTNELRASRRTHTHQRALECRDPITQRKLFRQCLSPSRALATAVVDALTTTWPDHVDVVVAPHEAEAYCAQLCARDEAWAAVTEDMDALTFGAKRQLRHCSSTTLSNCNFPSLVLIDLETLLEESKLTRAQFIDFCVLSGCDFCPTIPRIGPITAYKLITKHGSVEAILKNEPKLTVPDSFSEAYLTAHNLFLNNV